MRKSYLHVTAIVASLLLGGLTAVHLGQDLNWDLLNYHYYVPYAFLHHRIGFDIAPAQQQSYGNPLVDIPAYLLIAHLKPIFAGASLGALQGLNAWLVFEISLLLLRKRLPKISFRIGVSAIVAALSLYGAASSSEIGNAMGENITSLFILAGVWLLILAVSDVQTRVSKTKLRLIAYLIVGLGVGLKLNNAGYAVALLLAGLFVEGSKATKAKLLVQHSLAIIGGALISSGFWYLRLWEMFKNPIFPYFNGVFQSPYYANVNFSDQRWFPHGIGGKLFYPFILAHTQNEAAEIPFRDPRLAVLYVLLVIVGIKLAVSYKARAKWFSDDHREILVFWTFFIASYLLWEKQFSYYRYIIPIELLSLLAITLVIFYLLKPLVYTPTAIVVVTVIAITSFTIPINWGRIPWQKSYFGVNTGQSLPANSTVLIAGGQPSSFIIPFLPTSIRAIRVESNMTSPSSGTATEQNAIKHAIKTQAQRHSSFYALVDLNERAQEEATIKLFSYNFKSCHAIVTNSNTYEFKGGMQFGLCSIVKNS